jgi:hypothetical protein
MNWISAMGTVVGSALVIGFALSFSTLLAYSVMNLVIWFMQPRRYNEAGVRWQGFASSRRVLSSFALSSTHSGGNQRAR